MRVVLGFVIAALVMGAVIMWPTVSARQLPFPAGLVCRHDDRANAVDRARRDQALLLAQAINAAQGQYAARTRRYAPLAELENLPPAPSDFQVRLYTDGAGYIFSIKAERDPCHYGIFSDQQGHLYEMSPQVPQAAS